MNWHEPIYFEGGPEWGPGSFGRGDSALFKPVDRTSVYPGDCGLQTYKRTNRCWICPVFGLIHTIFTYEAPGSETEAP